jgi:uncharacterized membrane protein
MKNRIFLVLIILFILPIVSAKIQNFDIEVRISNSVALISYDILTDQSSIHLNLPEDAIINEISEKNYSLKDGKLISEVSDSLQLTYSTSKFIERTSKSYFTADFKTPETDNLNVRLILPEFSVLDSAYPNPELTSDGKHIILSWKASNIDNFPAFVIYREKIFQWIWMILLVIAVIIAIFFWIKTKTKVIKVGVKPKKESKWIHLLESENSVIKALKENKGEMWQKQIQLKTGFSKAKLSRLIRDLESRGLIKRIPLGNTNKIKLK